VLVLVACLGKLGAGTLAARLSGLSWRESGALGILMNTRGLMVLLVLNLGLDAGIIGPTLFTMMVLMALLTTFITTPALDVVYPPGQHEQDLLATAPLHPLHPAEASAFTMLVCVDDDQAGRGLATLAAALDRAVPGARTHVLHLRSPASDGGVSIDDGERPAWLAPGFKPLSFVSTEPARDIRRVADVKAADLVLLGAGHAREGAMLGPTAQRVVNESHCTVAVLRDPTGIERVDRVLVVPSEDDEPDRGLLELCRRLLDGGAELEIQRDAGRPGGAAVDEFLATNRHARVVVRSARATSVEPRVDLIVACHPGSPWLASQGDRVPLLLVHGGSSNLRHGAST
jgi:nucleotide-binding universal stress UspA family protein